MSVAIEMHYNYTKCMLSYKASKATRFNKASMCAYNYRKW